MSALSPESRDTLLAELRTRTTKPGFHYLSQAHLARLNETVSDEAPVVSLYMTLTHEMRVGDAWEITFKDLSRRALDMAEDSQREAVHHELDRIEAALRSGLPRTGRGVALFACAEQDLFQQLGTALTLPNEVMVNRRPYVRPLARMRDEHDRFVIALVSSLKTRFFFSQIGLVEEVYTLDREPVEVTDHASKDQRQDIRAEARRDQAQQSAHAASLIVDALDARHLVYAVPSDMETDFMDALDQPTRQKATASFSCDINASVAEVASTAEPVQRQVEAHQELETIEKVQEQMASRAVAGLDDTLDMLNQQRVMKLVVDDDVRLEGGVDAQSGMLTLQTTGTYEATGGEIRTESDLIEVMLERAMAQGAELELVRSNEAKKALQEHGPVAALLRY